MSKEAGQFADRKKSNMNTKKKRRYFKRWGNISIHIFIYYIVSHTIFRRVSQFLYSPLFFLPPFSYWDISLAYTQGRRRRHRHIKQNNTRIRAAVRERE